jgi:DnaK suppressor protein
MTPEETRDLLLTRRSQLEGELKRLTAPPAETTSVSFGKRVGDGTTEAVERLSTTATAKSIAASITEIDHALGKLGAGTYGICDDCRQPIPEARLEVRPAASQCVDCAT